MTTDPNDHVLSALIAQVEAGLGAIPSDSEGFVLTLEDPQHAGLWVQISDGLANAAWPFPHQPEPLFEALCPSALVAFEPELYATFSLADVDVRDQSRWIAHYFVEILGCDPTLALAATVEDQGPVGAG
jgi:hypothetical protein